MRSWFIWLSLLLLAASLGWFWLLSHDLTFTRANQPAETKSAAEPQKPEPKKAR